MKKNLIKGILYVLGIIAVVFIVVDTNWKEVSVHISSLPLRFIGLLLLAQCFTIFLLALQWRSMALRVKKDVYFLDILKMNAKGSVVDAITPGVKAGGEVARVYELRKRLQIDFGKATIVVGLQKTLSLLSFLFLTLFSLIWFSFNMSIKYRHYLHIFVVGIAIFAIFLGALILFSLRPEMLIKLLNSFFSKTRLMGKIDKTLRDYNNTIRALLRDKRKFSIQMVLALFIWIFYAIKLFVVMKGLDIEMDFISIAAITFLTYIMGMIPILPGSIGSFESSMLVLLAIKGISIEMGLSIAFIFRFVTFW
ncbi:MAG: flippase-like domain-containing protein, partial [Clostridiales bacterium]|nr:flippase-like domain-containing protein [Clostridiales bacterium]